MGGYHYLAETPLSMDYRTLFVSDLCSLILFAIAFTGIAAAHRKMIGVRWFALSLPRQSRPSDFAKTSPPMICEALCSKEV